MGNAQRKFHERRATEDGERVGPSSSTAPDGQAKRPSPPLPLPAPTITGVPHGLRPEEQPIFVDLAIGLARVLASRLPLAESETWQVLYSTSIHGSSFPRLVANITNMGPTLVVIASHDGRVIGGYNHANWQTVADRKGSLQRGIKAQRQHEDYTGSSECFVFSASVIADSTPTIYTAARPEINANFMYLVDKHPTDETLIGFGMGGRPRHQAWFVESGLRHCRCDSTCVTFDSPSLHPTASGFDIKRLEVYGLDPARMPPEQRRERERVKIVKGYAADAAGTTASDAGKGNSILNRASGADIALLQLGGVHQFRFEELMRENKDDEE